MVERVAYLLNQYPKVSHTFIRTEILALEKQGVAVERIAVRGRDAEIVDEADRIERERTRYVLAAGPIALAGAVAAAMLGRPRRFLSALATAWSMGRGGERSSLFHLIYLAEACLVLRWVTQARVGHVHAHFGSNAATVAMLVRRLGGPPFSFTVHGPEEFDKPLQLKLREKIGAARFVVAITSFCRSQLYRWSEVTDWSKIAVVHCALDDRFVAARGGKEGAAASVPTLVCVGRLCEQKGQLLLVEVIAMLRARGVAVRLVLAGDGEMRPLIEEAIARRSLAEVVTITGWLSAEQVAAAVTAGDALVLPSFAEGLPVVIMEAMALERPVVTTIIAGIPELVRDGREGLLVPAGDAPALADAIERLLAMSPADQAAVGQAARARVRERHDSATEAAKLVRLIQSDG